MSDTHTFSHEAMKTTFTLRIRHTDSTLARKAANEAILLIDDIEETLSRYIPGSDVWQINHMANDESIFLNDLTYDCLRIALEVSAASNGLFDITLGRQIEHQKNETQGEAPPIIGQLMLDPERPAIHCIQAGREVDLGGIGKGFALDQIKGHLLNWEISDALLSAGASTHLAFGETVWPIQKYGSNETGLLELNNQALSVSSTDVQGSHIILPFTEQALDYCRPRIWVQHPQAAYADAWSTACMLMSDDEIKSLQSELIVFS